MADESRDKVPSCPNALFNFPEHSIRVEDADEEVSNHHLLADLGELTEPIMELYMNLAATESPNATGNAQGGLGFLDASKAILDLELELIPPEPPSQEPVPKSKVKRGAALLKSQIVSVQLHQDLQMLKQSKGDTGSVLWRSSLYLARHLLAQHAFPVPYQLPLLDPSRLATSRILELGSGTGLLAILLGPLSGEYVASDRYENLRLIQRNIELNDQAGLKGAGKKAERNHRSARLAKEGRIRIEEVDWEAISAEKRRRGYASGFGTPTEGDHPYDAILAVDCIYNEALVQPLVDTFAKYCAPGSRTVIWVVVELRSSDVMTLFLDTWLNDSSGPWCVVRLAEGAMGTWNGSRGRWVGWIGWR